MLLSHRFLPFRGIFDTRALTITPARVVAAAFLLATLAFGGCAQQPQQFAAAPHHGKEYFPSTVYGPASRRVIADGQPVPRGGGQYLVGKPYTVAGHKYYPSERRISQVGNASWYGDAFHGRLTANGEIYDRDGFTAAHPTMPLPSYARVTNLRNNYSMIVRVNDRGPYASSRIMDVSRRVAEALDYKRYGTTRLRVEYVGRASLAGSDDAKLFATLRSGTPAQWQPEPTMIAQAAPPPAQVASIAPYAPPPPRREWRQAGEPRAEEERPPAIATERVSRRATVARMEDAGVRARTRMAMAEPPRREVAAPSARESRVVEERQVRRERAEPARERTARGQQPAARGNRGDADAARQFALAELRPASHGSTGHGSTASNEASQAHAGLSRRPAALPPTRPAGIDAMARNGSHHHGIQMARARDD